MQTHTHTTNNNIRKAASPNRSVGIHIHRVLVTAASDELFYRHWHKRGKKKSSANISIILDDSHTANYS